MIKVVFHQLESQFPQNLSSPDRCLKIEYIRCIYSFIIEHGIENCNWATSCISGNLVDEKQLIHSVYPSFSTVIKDNYFWFLFVLSSIAASSCIVLSRITFLPFLATAEVSLTSFWKPNKPVYSVLSLVATN